MASEVPQEGALTPIPFSVYFSEIPSLATQLGVTCGMFADDIKICKNVNGPNDYIAL